MRKLFQIIKILFFSLLALAAIIFCYLWYVSRIEEPVIADTASLSLQPSGNDTILVTIGDNWLRKSKSGLWEMYVEGSPFERGVVNGKLAKRLVHEQEAAFNDQIEKLVPSSFYRRFLKYFIGWFNRDLENHVTEEYKEEIYGVSLAASHEFDYIGTPFQRLMNYHAAHDIGHALQNLALVGCTSFAEWNTTADSSNTNSAASFIIGRNFDFYVGDRFAENKIVQFVKPDSGHPFMMVTWGGMIGAVSGMNLEGLTITLNATKSSVPSGSATPISLVAREVLQYASNIQEAVSIARSRKVFVSESFLVGSAHDGKAVSIEVSPDTVVVFEPSGTRLVCSNHYQGAYLGQTELNKGQMEQSSSTYRQQRMNQLLDQQASLTPEKTANILRNIYGLNDKHIGFGNEKAVNQLICHHAVIFEPIERRVWVSTSPWNLGSFTCYQLDSVFALHGMRQNHEIADSLFTIPADSFLYTSDFKKFLEFRAMRQRFADGLEIDPAEIVKTNPDYYFAYMIAGDYLFNKKDFEHASGYYQEALKKEIATRQEEIYIQKQLDICTRKTN